MKKSFKNLLKVAGTMFVGFLTVSLTACLNIDFGPTPDPTVKPTPTPTPTPSEPVVTPTPSEPVVTPTPTNDPTKDPTTDPTVAPTPTSSKTPDPTSKTELDYTYKDYQGVYGCPTEGNVKLLVIPIWFTDSGNYIKSSYKETVRSDIEKAYFGTNEETGWRSVKTFYEEESSGKLTLTGFVSEWYNTGKSVKTFGTDGDGTKTGGLVTEAVDWFFDNHSTHKRSDYDSDKDGYLDGVMLIYGAPNSADNTSGSYGDYDNLWAYCYWVQEENTTTEPIANVYFWASYDFMYSKSSGRTGTSYGYGDTRNCTIDAHTYIHEMGHVFGLDDYYDYSYTCNPAGGFSMQDYNVGGHDPFSVMTFGWADPYIVSDDATVTIGSFQDTRDFVLLTNEWNENNSPFDEYLLLELYTPTGLNKFDCDYTYAGAMSGPKTVGIRMWHVDARLAWTKDYKYGAPNYHASQLTTDPYYGDSATYLTQAFTNTCGVGEDGDAEGYCSVLGKSYYFYNLLQLIRNDKSATYKSDDNLAASDLFTNGTYKLSDYSKQFVKGAKMNNGSALTWNIKVEISGSGASAKATLTITK